MLPSCELVATGTVHSLLFQSTELGHSSLTEVFQKTLQMFPGVIFGWLGFLFACLRELTFIVTSTGNFLKSAF